MQIFRIAYTVLSFIFIVNGQTQSQIDQAKKYIEKAGLDEADVRRMAKSKGYTNQEINKVINKPLWGFNL